MTGSHKFGIFLLHAILIMTNLIQKWLLNFIYLMRTYIITKPGKSSLRIPLSVCQAPKHTYVWRCIYEVNGDQRAVQVEPELPSGLCPVAGMWSSNLQVATGGKSMLFAYNLCTCSGVQVQIYKASLRARPDEVYYSSETPQNTAERTPGARWLGTVMVWNVDHFLFSSDNVNSAENTNIPSKFRSASSWVHWRYFQGHGWWVHRSTGDGFIGARVTPCQLHHWAVHSYTVMTQESCVSAAPCGICRKFSGWKILTPGSQQLLLLV